MSQKVMTGSQICRPSAWRSDAWRVVVRSVQPRREWPGMFALVLALLGPGMSAARAASTQTDDASPRERSALALPRQFSVEVLPGGVLFADGTRLGAPSELGRWAQRALAGARFAGAVVFGDDTRDGATIGEVVETLHRAGFNDVRRVGRPAPPEVSAATALRVAPVVSAGKAPAPNLAPMPARAPAVTLATVGLHVDGKLDQEPHRSRLVKVFEREFGSFRRCHGRAERHERGASFGVDLFIPKSGGRAKVRQTRTRLENKAFRQCMLAAFESIRFAPPASQRAEVVSYSVLFKPNAR
jgi:hypothetical protein